MAVRHGYGKVATNGLVFAYDTGETRNSYKGKPATNILKFINQQYSNYDETYFKLTNGSHQVNIPTLGTRTVKYVDIWNDYNGGSGQCCLSLFGFGTGITAVQPSTTYMYQIIYKTDTGYSHPNYMYRYEYGASGYIKEGGLHSTSRRTALGDGWYHGWGSFTTDANTTSLNTYLFHYEYATQNRVQVAAVMLTEGTEIIPPNQFIGFEQTRSATQGLLDLTRNTSINLSNVSFDSSAQMTFDGTSDFIALSPVPDINQRDYSLETVVYRASTGTVHGLWSDYQYGFFGVYISSANVVRFRHMTNPTYASTDLAGSTTIGVGTYHIVNTYSTTEGFKTYVNGVLDASTSATTAFTLSSGRGLNKLGVYEDGAPSNANSLNGKIHVAKAYHRVLTADEVRNNYRHYKTRFDI